MNRYIRAGTCILIGTTKFAFLKLFHANKAKLKIPCLISPRTEITLDRGGNLSIGRNYKMRSGSKLRIRRGGTVTIGESFSMSNVLLEAAACGRPAIAADRSGCRETVDDGITGYIVPVNDEAAVLDAVEKFLNLTWEQQRTRNVIGS